MTYFILLKSFIKYLKPYWFKEMVLLVLMILTSLASLASPFILKIIIDKVFPSGDFNYLLEILAILVSVNIIRIAISFCSDYLYQWISNHIVFDLRKDLFNHLIHLPLSFFSNNKTGDLIHRINSEVNSVQNMLTGSLIRFINSLFTILGLSVALCLLNWRLFAISMVVIPFVFLNTRYFQPKIHKIIKKARENDSDILNFFVERFENIILIKSYNRYNYENSKLSTEMKSLISLNMINVKLSSTTRSISTLLVTFSPILVFAWGGKEVMMGVMTLGSLVAFIQYLNRFFNPMRDIMSLYWDLIRSSVSMQRIFEFMEQPRENENLKVLKENIFHKSGNNSSSQKASDNSSNYIKIERSIQLRNIYFKYDNNWILNNLTLEFEKGKKYALVGASGCGKSTIIKLINRFYEPQNGGVYIDGSPIKGMKYSDLREITSLVTQESQLFHESIMENIRYGDLGSTDEEIMEIAKITGIYDHACTLKHGIYSIIGDKGTKISGGQKQRISIARAVLKKPKLIILDEATSALDSESEKQIFLNLCRIYKNKTMILISHRISTIKDVDEIIYLENGQVVEKGSYKELIKNKGVFWTLFKEQIE